MPHPEWSKWEIQVAQDLDGKLQPGSGNKWFAKGDVKTDTHKISCKQTANSSFTVTNQDLKEIQEIAMQDLKSWALAVDLNGRKIIIIDYQDFVEAMSGVV